MTDMTPERAGALRAEFNPTQIGKLPKPYSKDSQKGNCRECGGYHGLPAVHLDYVGHAATTDRLLSVDPSWSWRPFTQEEVMALPPAMREAGLWIQLTVCGVTKPGFGDAGGKSGGNAVKEAIGDAIRNAAMRFGVALDLWSKEDLQAADQERGREPTPEEAAIQAAAAELDAAKRRAWTAWQAYSGGTDAAAMREEYEQFKAQPLEDATTTDFIDFAEHLEKERADAN